MEGAGTCWGATRSHAPTELIFYCIGGADNGFSSLAGSRVALHVGAGFKSRCYRKGPMDCRMRTTLYGSRNSNRDEHGQSKTHMWECIMPIGLHKRSRTFCLSTSKLPCRTCPFSRFWLAVNQALKIEPGSSRHSSEQLHQTTPRFTTARRWHVLTVGRNIILLNHF